MRKRETISFFNHITAFSSKMTLDIFLTYTRFFQHSWTIPNPLGLSNMFKMFYSFLKKSTVPNFKSSIQKILPMTAMIATFSLQNIIMKKGWKNLSLLLLFYGMKLSFNFIMSVVRFSFYFEVIIDAAEACNKATFAFGGTGTTRQYDIKGRLIHSISSSFSFRRCSLTHRFWISPVRVFAF